MDIETETRTETCVHTDPFIYLNICNYIAICCCLVAKSCLTLCDPKGYNLPGSSAHEISQARVLE